MQLALNILVGLAGMSIAISQGSAQPIRLTEPITVVEASDPAIPPYSAALRVLTTSDGAVLLIRVGAGRIDKVFASGKSRSVARDGDGPGEFRMISAAGFRGDSLWVVDEVHRRLTIFPRLGEGRPVTKSIGSGTSSVAAYLPLTLSDGNLAWALQISEAIKFNMTAAKRVPIARTNHVGAVHASGPAAETLDIWSRTHRIELPGLRSASFKAQLFSDRSLIAASANGKFWAIVNQPDPSEEPNARREVAMFKGSGERVVRTAIPLAKERLERVDRERLIDSVVGAMDSVLRASGETGSISNAFRQALFIPQLRTPVLDLLVADDGAMLMRGNDWGRGSVRYMMMNAAGAVTGQFTVPARQVVKAFTQSRLWSLIEDEDGQARLVVQQLVR